MLKWILFCFLIFSSTAFGDERVWSDLVAGLPSDTMGQRVNWKPPCPLPKNSGVIWQSQPYKHFEDTWIRVHFVFDNIPANATWKINIKGSDDQIIESITRENLQIEDNQSDWWSGRVQGNWLRVELSSDGSDLDDFCPQVDIIKYPTVPVSRFSRFGKFSWENITALGSQHRRYKIGQSVARIVIPDRNGNDNSCTGFLVSNDRMFTNSHCFQNADTKHICGPDKLKVRFNEETGRTIQEVGCQELEVNYPYLDLAVIKLESSPRSNRSPLTLSRGLPIQTDATAKNVLGTKLAVIQHPLLGDSFLKQIVRSECERRGELMIGAFPDPDGSALYPQPDFGHICDTDGGSSGSPVIDENDYVVGLHHWGLENSPSPYNRAVAMAKILQWLETNHKPIFDQLQVVGP
ncbi:MAG: trypsin-like serine peptidase [Methylobacter sp.]